MIADVSHPIGADAYIGIDTTCALILLYTVSASLFLGWTAAYEKHALRTAFFWLSLVFWVSEAVTHFLHPAWSMPTALASAAMLILLLPIKSSIHIARLIRKRRLAAHERRG
jgi:hypothetical protein